MTYRVLSAAVLLDPDYREEDIDKVMAAILMVKGVTGVKMGMVDESEQLTKLVVRSELRGKLLQAVRDVFDEE